VGIDEDEIVVLAQAAIISLMALEMTIPRG